MSGDERIDVMNTTDISAEVTRYLDKLGTTTAEIRTSLADLGVRGQLSKTDGCPLSRYLAQEMPGLTVVVGMLLAFVPHTDSPYILLSVAQRQFVCNFDSGYYPELISCD